VPNDGCFPSPGIWGANESHVRATSDDGTNEHTYGGTEDSDPTIHAMGSCPEGPSPCMWPKFMDYNQAQVADQNNFFGQPILFALGYRDLTKAPKDPWNLNFDFNVLGDAKFDNMAAGGTEISKAGFDSQVSLSAAIAYYHRAGHWKEPPNFFNPFWRATLYKPDSDAEVALTAAGFLTAAETTTLLRAAGFKGGL
jgi:hypothetical protein